MSLTTTLLSLPDSLILLSLVPALPDLSSHQNLSSTCRRLRECLSSTNPKIFLPLAANQSRELFRPSPHFLLLAVAKQLGNWARESEANEREFRERCKLGVEGLMELATEKCGITMERVREMHEAKFERINPVCDAIDRCVGEQWYATENFWNGGVDDAYTVDSDPELSGFHLAIYGELFGVDLERYLDETSGEAESGAKRTLEVETRLEFVKYCIPDWITAACAGYGTQREDGSVDPRREAGRTGPYERKGDGDEFVEWPKNNNLALVWTLKSSRWRPLWKEVRVEAGIEDFVEDFEDGWWYHGEDEKPETWRQRLLENVMVCQGLDGFGMLRPGLAKDWFERIREWRRKIEKLEREDGKVFVGRQATYNHPYLTGDLRILLSGYVPGS